MKKSEAVKSYACSNIKNIRESITMYISFSKTLMDLFLPSTDFSSTIIIEWTFRRH